LSLVIRGRRRRRRVVTLGEMLRGWARGFVYIFLAVTLITIVSLVGKQLVGLASLTTPIQTGTDANGNPVYLTIDLGWIFNLLAVFSGILAFMYGIRQVLRVRL